MSSLKCQSVTSLALLKRMAQLKCKIYSDIVDYFLCTIFRVMNVVSVLSLNSIYSGMVDCGPFSVRNLLNHIQAPSEESVWVSCGVMVSQWKTMAVAVTVVRVRKRKEQLKKALRQNSLSSVQVRKHSNPVSIPSMTMNMTRFTDVGITINISPNNDFLISFSRDLITRNSGWESIDCTSRSCGDSGRDGGVEAVLNCVTPITCLVKDDNDSGGWICARAFTKLMSCQTKRRVSQKLIDRSKARSAPATFGCRPIRHLSSAPISAIEDTNVYAITPKIPVDTMTRVMM